MTDIIWDNPPAKPTRTPRTSKYDDLAAALRRRPGKFALFSAHAANSTASSINRGKIAAFRPAGDFEAVGQTVDGTFKVWVRYVGTKETRSAQLAQIRAWARVNNWTINNRGRIPQQIIDAYHAAQETES